MRNSLFRTAYELLFIPVPAAHKRPVKAILDVGLDRVGTVLGSGVVMAVLAGGAPATSVLPALTATNDWPRYQFALLVTRFVFYETPDFLMAEQRPAA